MRPEFLFSTETCWQESWESQDICSSTQYRVWRLLLQQVISCDSWNILMWSLHLTPRGHLYVGHGLHILQEADVTVAEQKYIHANLTSLRSPYPRNQWDDNSNEDLSSQPCCRAAVQPHPLSSHTRTGQDRVIKRTAMYVYSGEAGRINLLTWNQSSFDTFITRLCSCM